MCQSGTEKSANRCPGAELSSETRAAIISAREAGESPSKIAKDFGVSRSTVYETCDHFQNHATTKSRPRTGAPKTFNHSTTRYAILLARRNPKMSLSELSACIPGNPSRSTLKRILRPQSLQRSQARRDIPISKRTAN